MYVATFYSFKGGVGRTLALLNVAYEMAQSGLRVLVVDFDLEAPAIHADRWKSTPSGTTETDVGASFDHPGIIEYVSTYMESMRAPEVSDHIVDATPDNCSGAISLMPAGRIDESYGSRLNAIDWNELYVDYDGYVMFEDMRAQWEALHVDYVLLDSRTGFTDVGGICTRHLPDAVVTLFRPDDQSLRGMKGVVQSIRNEGTTPRRQQPVALHFVMASIPDADDEDGILARHRRAFRTALSIPPGRLLEVRQYQSMDLLTQPIYTRTRPRTSLAGSYRELTEKIRALNVHDRDGVLDYLTDAGKGGPDPHDETYLGRIRQEYAEDAGVLGELAETSYCRGSILDAADLFERMADLGSLSKRHQMRLAESRHVTGDHEGAAKALMMFFQSPVDDSSPEVNSGLIFRGLNMLEARREDRSIYLDGSPVISVLSSSHQAEVAEGLDLSPPERRVAAAIFERILRDGDVSPEIRDGWEWGLAFACMAITRFAEARAFFERAINENLNVAPIPTTFNLAMAMWAESGEPDAETFRQVLKALDVEEDKSPWLDDANALQALAVAAWFGGRRDDADAYLDAAEEVIRGNRSAISCWSYTRVPHKRFHDHCEEIHRLLSGEDLKPDFIRSPRGPES